MIGEMTTIDLCKPGDLDLVHRAVVNGWDVPQHICDQITAQIEGAIEFYRRDMSSSRKVRRFLRLGKLMLAMEATNALADGHLKSWYPYLRRRGPERRRPRRERAMLRKSNNSLEPQKSRNAAT